MNQNLIAWSIAVVLLGIPFGSYIRYDERKTRQMNRRQYLAREAHKYNESKSSPTPLGTLVILGLFVSVYEDVVLIISEALKSRGVGAGKSTGDLSLPFSERASYLTR